jgi:hypothetical protein
VASVQSGQLTIGQAVDLLISSLASDVPNEIKLVSDALQQAKALGTDLYAYEGSQTELYAGAPGANPILNAIYYQAGVEDPRLLPLLTQLDDGWASQDAQDFAVSSLGGTEGVPFVVEM